MEEIINKRTNTETTLPPGGGGGIPIGGNR